MKLEGLATLKTATEIEKIRANRKMWMLGWLVVFSLVFLSALAFSIFGAEDLYPFERVALVLIVAVFGGIFLAIAICDLGEDLDKVNKPDQKAIDHLDVAVTLSPLARDIVIKIQNSQDLVMTRELAAEICNMAQNETSGAFMRLSLSE